MEIIQERIEREFNLDIITTAPSVIYKVMKTMEKYYRSNKSNKFTRTNRNRLYGRASS